MLANNRFISTLDSQSLGTDCRFFSLKRDSRSSEDSGNAIDLKSLEALPQGEWKALSDGDGSGLLLLKACKEAKDTASVVHKLRSSHPDTPIILLLDLKLVKDLETTLRLDVSDFHSLDHAPELLNTRIRKWSSQPVDSSMNSTIKSEEAAIWRTHFQSAGAGMLTGNPQRFLSAKTNLLRIEEGDNGQLINTRIKAALRLIQWELNNEKAIALLDLKDPISLSSGFLDSIEFLNPKEFACDLALLGNGKRTIQGELHCSTPENRGRTLSAEMSIPTGMKDSILVTLIDITQRINLEEDLRNHVNLLESRVADRTKAIRLVNSQLQDESRQRQRLAKQVRDNLVNITNGVISAKKILDVALPGKKELRTIFPQSILLERPRDIMGGDFLFTSKKNGKKYLALIDSTGHGIPGAMVSLMGSTLINTAFAALTEPTPSEILNHFHVSFRERMQVQNESTNMYGFDAGILMLDEAEGVLEFAGARGDLYLVRNGETKIYRGTRNSIELNKYNREMAPSYERHSINLNQGDQFYLVTDGIRDQFGGELNRKLGRKRFADILAQNSLLELPEREKALQQALLIWKGANAKVDDATLVGIDITL